MTKEPQHYLAVLKASYDYDPQSEDEIPIKEDQILLLIERVDDDWWKVKVKGNTQDTDGDIGLVPAAYVEQAEHTSVVKALYDYEGTAQGELTVHEDDVLLVFETEDDWILVQDKTKGKAGYVPGNYVEPFDEEETSPPPSRIVVPDSPPPPVSTYVDPAERVASAKVAADDIQTWSVSEIDKKGKKKKGTLGIGNGSVFFASESDKNPVQKWQTLDVTAAANEKAKHVRLDIGGVSPTTLLFNAGSKENADNIAVKLQTSKSLASPSNRDSIATLPRTLPPRLDSPPKEAKKATVHFSPSVDVIIRDDDADDLDEQQDSTEESDPTLTVTALYDFVADGDDELSVNEGEVLTLLDKDSDEWWKCKNSKGAEGVVPASYLEESASDKPATSSPVDDNGEAQKAQALLAQREAERLQKEDEEQRKFAEARKLEAQQRKLAEERRQEAQQRVEAAATAELERQRRKEARTASPQPQRPPEPARNSTPSSPPTNSRASAEVNASPLHKVRTWQDRSGKFTADATFLGFSNGKLRLHKVNGVVVEVPAEKMSVEDMRYVEKYLDKKNRPANGPRISEDDIPLAMAKNVAQKNIPNQKKAPKIDWFEFFLNAGCDMDDCTRYAAAFEKDKIDGTILSDVSEETLRRLGLREGDVIRVMKAIEKRKPTDNLVKPSPYVQEQLRRDEELARQLQAQESGGSLRSPPNLFTNPGGVLKQRRGRPQPSKSLPPSNVDLHTISSASEQIQRTSSPQAKSPSTPQTSASINRPGSAPIQSGFDDNAWENRPSSAKPALTTSPLPQTPVSPPVPAQPVQPTPTPTTIAGPPQPTPTPTTTAGPPQPTPTQTATPNPPTNLAKTTNSDIFDQLARLSELRKNTAPPSTISPVPAPINVPPPAGFNSGMGMGLSPIPMGRITTPSLSPSPQQFNNGPRGPFAPVASNQPLLQPLIPTQTSFSGFIPTNRTGFQPQNQLNVSPFTSPTFQPPTQPMFAQPTGNMFNSPFNNVAPPPVPQLPVLQTNGGGMNQLQSHITGFNPPLNASPFNNNTSGFNAPLNPLFNATPGIGSIPPLPTNNSNNASNSTSPANVFAQMKSGTFANDNENQGYNGMNGGQNGWR